MKRSIAGFIVVLVIGSAAALSLGACSVRRAAEGAREVHVDVTENGFEPAEVKIPAGQAATLVMTRKTDQTCATEVEFASLHQKYALQLNQPVRIALAATPAETLSYQCGMHMLAGRIVIQ